VENGKAKRDVDGGLFELDRSLQYHSGGGRSKGGATEGGEGETEKEQDCKKRRGKATTFL